MPLTRASAIQQTLLTRSPIPACSNHVSRMRIRIAFGWAGAAAVVDHGHDRGAGQELLVQGNYSATIPPGKAQPRHLASPLRPPLHPRAPPGAHRRPPHPLRGSAPPIPPHPPPPPPLPKLVETSLLPDFLPAFAVLDGNGKSLKGYSKLFCSSCLLPFFVILVVGGRPLATWQDAQGPCLSAA